MLLSTVKLKKKPRAVKADSFSGWVQPPEYQAILTNPMHLVYPRPNGETQTMARHKWAHTDFPYRITVGVQGGRWPFKYELIQAPPGARMGRFFWEVDYGCIEWQPSTTSGTYQWEVRITDQLGDVVTSTWTTTIDNNAFVIIDPTIPASGVGTVLSPLKTMMDWYVNADDTTHINKIAVVRGGGTLYFPSIVGVNNNNFLVKGSAKNPAIIGWPGEGATINAGSSKYIANLDSVNDIYVADIIFDTTRSDVSNSHFFWIAHTHNRTAFYNCIFKNQSPGTAGNDNQGCIFLSQTNNAKNYFMIKNCVFDNVQTNNGGNGHYFDTYWCNYILAEGNIIKNSNATYGLWVKAALSYVSVRNNVGIENNRGRLHGWGGSLGKSGSTLQPIHENETCYNKFRTLDEGGMPSVTLGYDSPQTSLNNTFYKNSIYNDIHTGNPAPDKMKTYGNLFNQTGISTWYNEDRYDIIRANKYGLLTTRVMGTDFVPYDTNDYCVNGADIY